MERWGSKTESCKSKWKLDPRLRGKSLGFLRTAFIPLGRIHLEFAGVATLLSSYPPLIHQTLIELSAYLQNTVDKCFPVRAEDRADKADGLISPENQECLQPNA